MSSPLTPEQQGILDKYYPLYQHFSKTQSIPNGSLPALRELDRLSQQLGSPPASLHCGACQAELLMKMYKGYAPRDEKE